MEFNELVQLLFNNHLLASEGTVSSVLSAYNLAIRQGSEQVGLVQKPLKSRRFGAKVFQKGDSKVGLIPVRGALTYQETGWEAMCGMCSYEHMQGVAEYMIKDQKVQELVLELNSGGGQAYGCFETAQRVRDLATENNVKITTYVDGVAFSGGYAWACIADEVIMNPMAKVGSIGVVLPLVNTAARDKKEGIERIYVTSGKSKVPYDSKGNFTKEALAELQSQSTEIYNMFVNHVATNRGIEVKAVEDTEAKTFTTTDALKLGLADKVMSKVEFYKHFEGLYGEGIMSTANMQKPQEDVSKVETPALVTQLNATVASLQGDVAAEQAKVTSLTEQVTALTGEAAVKDTEIETLKTQLAEALGEAAKVQKADREAKVKVLVSEDDFVGAMEVAEGLSNEKFDAYVKTLAGKKHAVEASMVEIGDSGVDHQGAEVSAEQKMLDRVKAQQAR